MKITILGHCGSGKTSLAKHIHANYNLPHLELDRVWFLNGGNDVKNLEEKNKIREKMHLEVEEFIRQNDSWVIDGIYKQIQPFIIKQATHVVYLKVPFYKRIYYHVYRIIFFERHPEISLWQDICFTFKMCDHTIRTNKKLRPLLKQADKKLFVITEDTMKEWLESTFKNY